MKYAIIVLSLFAALLVGASTGADAHPKPPCLRGRCHPTATLIRTPTPTDTPTKRPTAIFIECFRAPCGTPWGNVPKLPKLPKR